MELPEIVTRLTEAVRLWGAIAGVFGLASIVGPKGCAGPSVPPWSAPVTQFGVCAFLVTAGIAIPFAEYSGMLAAEDMLFRWILLLAWYAIAVAAWAGLSHHSKRMNMMRGAAWVSFITMLVAAFLMPFA